MAATTSIRSLESALRAAPATHALGVYQGDELVKKVPMRAGRNRVSLTMQVIERLTWSRIELLDRKDGLLGVVDNDAAPAAMEDISSKEAARDMRLLDLMLRAQKTALDHRLEESKAMSDAMVRCMDVIARSVKTLADIYREQADVAADIGAQEAALAQKERELADVERGRRRNGHDDEVGDIVKAALTQKLLESVAGAGPAGGKPES